MRKVRRTTLAALVASLLAASAVAQTVPSPRPKLAGNVAPYYPTPIPVVRLMLDAASIKPGELVYDLGSGDGRVVILAARDYGARAVGYELDPKLVDSSRRQIAEMELGDLASVVAADLYTADLEKADVVVVYLLPRALEKLRPLLEEKLKPGSRVISHDFLIPGWEADETFGFDEEKDIDGLPHTVYVYKYKR